MIMTAATSGEAILAFAEENSMVIDANALIESIQRLPGDEQTKIANWIMNEHPETVRRLANQRYRWKRTGSQSELQRFSESANALTCGFVRNEQEVVVKMVDLHFEGFSSAKIAYALN